MIKRKDNRHHIWKHIWKHSLGLPQGTIRALALIILLLSTVYFGKRLFDMVADEISIEQLKQALIVFTAFNSLTSLMLGSYIKK